ncbi:MAG TPA: hypothetical protein VHS29_05880 [Candidatus Acidoferrales bacterium]|jgi:hypothetical protein|nr:hypothetical protein [Candidatus Acidoferrales bacterium]
MIKDPLYVLEVEPLDLGADVKAVGLDLVEIESREPVRGVDAAKLWAATLSALPGTDPWGFDFFSHLDRVREYCRLHDIAFEEKASGRSLVIPSPSVEALVALIERFAGETFGIRAGSMLIAGDPVVESELARRGVDAYHNTYKNYLFCAVCDFENGFLTLLTEKLWTSEVLRRIKPATAEMPVEVARPQ